MKSIKRKPENELYEFLDQVSEELIESDIDEALGDMLKKTGQSIKRGWMKLKSKIKEVGLWGFRLGVALGKTIKGKFVLFNKKGDILTPEMDYIGWKKYKATGKDTLNMNMNVAKLKGNNMNFWMSDDLSFGYGTATGPHNEGIMYVIDPKTPGIREGIDYSKDEILTEAEDDPWDEWDDEDAKESARAMADVDAETLGAFEGSGSKALSRSEDNPLKFAPVEVNYSHFKRELTTLMDMVKFGNVMKGGKIKNLAIYAPTGWGKSQIIESIAKEKGYHFFPLELQKVDINIIAGFPYLDDAAAAKDASDDIKEARVSAAKKIVRMAPSQFLPPSGDPGEWLLFFDEFNRADTEKMSAVMNLLLTGELGGASELVKTKSGENKLDRYKLPKKVVVVLAMNTGTQEGVFDATNAVNNLDIATLERVHRVLIGKYHAGSWFANYANKPTEMELESGKKIALLSRIPSIIKNYITDLYKQAGGTEAEKQEAPFLMPIEVAGGKGGGGARTMSPRSWTAVADRMIEHGYSLFNKLTDAAKEKYMSRAEKIAKQANDKNSDMPDDPKDYLFAAWLQDAGNQIKMMSMQAPEFGDAGVETVGKIVRSFIKKGKEGVSEENILFNYKAVRDLVKTNFSALGFGTHAKLLARLYNVLTKYDTEADILSYMEENGFPVLSKKGMAEQIYQTIKTLYNDLDIDQGDFVTFAHLIEDGAKKNETEVIREIHAKMVGKWDTYQEALKAKLKTKSRVEKELKADDTQAPDNAEKSNEDLEQFFNGLLRD